MSIRKAKLLSLSIITIGGLCFLSLKDDAFAKYKFFKFLHKSVKSKSYNPMDEITWTQIKDYGGINDIGSTRYIDVISHTNPADTFCPRSSGMAFSQASIRVHETQHMLHCQIQRLTGTNNPTTEGLYYGNGNGIIINKPKTKVTDFSNLIPQELIESPSPYQTYIIDQMRYPTLNNIGYLFNEWGSYISNIMLNMELEQKGKPEPDADSHAANYSPHFFGYMAIAMHYIRLNEPAALNDKQLKATFALYSQLTWQWMQVAANSPVFGNPNTIYGSRIKQVRDFYKYSAKFADVKNSLIAIYGKEWVDQLMSTGEISIN